MFRGRPVVEETTYTYDPAGRVAKSRTVRQSDWTDGDREHALALDEYERSLCDGCGQPKARAWHPHMAGRFAAGDIECQGCTALNDWVRQQSEAKTNEGRELKFYLVDQGPPDLDADPDIR